MDFPGGTMGKNLPAKAGDMGSIPGLEDSTSQLLNLSATTTEAHVPRAHAPQQEKPQQWEALQQRAAPAHHDCREPGRSNEDPAQPKLKKEKWKDGLPCGPVVKTPHSQHRGTGLIPGRRTKTLYAAKCSQKKKREKRQPTYWEKNHLSDKGLISTIHEKFLKLNN